MMRILNSWSTCCMLATVGYYNSAFTDSFVVIIWFFGQNEHTLERSCVCALSIHSPTSFTSESVQWTFAFVPVLWARLVSSTVSENGLGDRVSIPGRARSFMSFCSVCFAPHLFINVSPSMAERCHGNKEPVFCCRSLYDNNIQSLTNGTFDSLRSIQTLWVSLDTYVPHMW
jgi:hypothetical protein